MNKSTLTVMSTKTMLAASTSYFNTALDELLAFHNWTRVFGIRISKAYLDQLSLLLIERKRKDSLYLDSKRFSSEYELYYEAKFGLGNGKLMVRSAAEERSYGETSWPMTFITGVFNKPQGNASELVNIANWLPIRFRTQIAGDYGCWFGVDKGLLLEYTISLNMTHAVMERHMRWRDDKGRVVRIHIRRIISQERPDIAAIEYTVVPEFTGTIEFESGLDADMYNRSEAMVRKHTEVVGKGAMGESGVYLSTRTMESGIYITEASRLEVFVNDHRLSVNPQIREEQEKIFQGVSVQAKPGQEIRLEKTVSIMCSKDKGLETLAQVEGAAQDSVMHAPGFILLFDEHALAWKKIWDDSGLTVEGDQQVQMAVNFCNFSLLQSARPEQELANIGARLFGEHYKGHTFWDTEIYMLPIFTYTQPATARALLLYRYYALTSARARAQAEGYAGARFPWRSGMVRRLGNGYAGGEELTTPQIRDFDQGPIPGEDLTGRFEIHVNWDIVVGLKRYYEATRDMEFLENYGVELMLEIARFAASPQYTVWNEEHKTYDTRSLGPNEWGERDPATEHIPGVLNNAYNNVMTAFTIFTALEYFQLIPTEKRLAILRRMNISEEQFAAFEARGRDIIQKIYIPYSPQTQVILESEYFLDRLAIEGFVNPKIPWYDSKIRNEVLMHLNGQPASKYQVVRQPDTMMLFVLRELFSEEFTSLICEKFGKNIFDDEHLEINRQFYTQKTSGESSLVFTAVCIYELMSGHLRKAMEAFLTGVRILGETSRQKVGRQGIAAANSGGVFYALVRGFAGLQISEQGIRVAPILPEGLKRIQFKIYYRGIRIEFNIAADEIIVTPMATGDSEEQTPTTIPMYIYQEKVDVQVGQQNKFPLNGKGLRFIEPDIASLDNSFHEFMDALSRVVRNTGAVDDQQRSILAEGIRIIKQHQGNIASYHWYVYDALALLLQRHILPCIEEGRSFERPLVEEVLNSTDGVSKNYRHTIFLNTLANFFKREREYEKSLMILRIVQEIDPRNTDALNTIAYIYLAQGNSDLALRTFRSVLDIDANDSTARTGISDLVEGLDCSRTYPNQEPVKKDKVREAIERCGGINNTQVFIPIELATEEVQRAIFYLRSIGDHEAAGYLEYIVKAGLIRAGPISLSGIIAAIYFDYESNGRKYIVFATNDPLFNIPVERAASLIRLVSELLHRQDSRDRTEKFLVTTSIGYSPRDQHMVMQQAAGLTEAQIRAVCEQVAPRDVALLKHDRPALEKDRTSLVIINARLYGSFQAITAELKYLGSLGVRKVLLIGSFGTSKMSEKYGRGDSDIPTGGQTGLYLSKDSGGRIVSIVWKDDSSLDAKGEKDLSAAAFSLPEYKISSALGGMEQFNQLITDAQGLGIDIFLDYVPHSTSVDATWLLDESLQIGEGYWYVYKDVSPEDQSQLSAVVDETALIALSEKILRENRGYFLHYSAKLGRWIFLVLSRDATMKPKEPAEFFNDLQVLIDITNPDVRKALSDVVVRMAEWGVRGVRVDCAQSVILGYSGQDRGFFTTWRDHHLTNANPQGQEELYAQAIRRAKEIAPDFEFFGESFWFFNELEGLGFSSLYQLHVYNLLRRKADIPALRRYLRDTSDAEQSHRSHGAISHDDNPNYRFERMGNQPAVVDRFLNHSALIASLPGRVIFHDEQLGHGYLVAATNRRMVIDDTPHPDVQNLFRDILGLAEEPLMRKGGMHVLSASNQQVLAFARYAHGNTAIVVSNLTGFISRYKVEEIGQRHAVQWGQMAFLFEPPQEGAERLSLEREFDHLLQESVLPQAFKDELTEYLLKVLEGETVQDMIPLADAAYKLGIQDRDVYYAFINRLTGEVLLRSGSELLNEGLFVVLPPHMIQVFLLQGIRDQQEELRWMRLRSKGQPLSMEDIYILMQKFGLELNFAGKGDIAKAEALKYMLRAIPTAQEAIALMEQDRQPDPNPAYPGRLKDDFIKPDAVKPGEEPVKYLDSAKEIFGIDYELVGSTTSGNIAEWNQSTHKIDILKDLIARAPPYRAGTHATFAFQAIINDIFTHEAEHKAGEAKETPAIAASIKRFRNNKAELLAFHNWVGVFGLELNSEYRAQLNKLEAEMLGPVSFKGAIFDFDGVIVDTNEQHFLAWKIAVEGRGLKEVDRAYYEKNGSGVPGNSFIARMFPEYGYDQRIELLEHVRRIFWQLVDEQGVKVFRTSLALARDLDKANIICAIATSAASKSLARSMKGMSVEDRSLFKTSIRSDDVGTGKPYPEPFLYAAFQLGLRFEEAAIFEDAAKGVAAAKDGGFKTIGIDRHGFGLLGRADKVVKDLGEVNYSSIAELFASYRGRKVFIQELIRAGLPLALAKKEAQSLLEDNGRYLYFGSDYVAISSARKDFALEQDRMAHPEATEGIAVGFGDSKGDVPFLDPQYDSNVTTNSLSRFKAYLPFFVGSKLSQEAKDHGVMQTTQRNKEATKTILGLLLKANGTMTYRQLFKELSGLVTTPESLPTTRVDLDAICRVSVIYSDKDDTLTTAYGELEKDLAETIARLLQSRVRFVLVTSNMPADVKNHFIGPVTEAIRRVQQDRSLVKQARSLLAAYYYNAKGHFVYNSEDKKYIRLPEKVEMILPSETMVMMYKMYAWAFVEFLSLSLPEVVLDAQSLSRLNASHDLLEIIKIFDSLVAQRIDLVGEEKEDGSGKKHNNLYFDTMGDAFASMETCAAAPIFREGFTSFVEKEVRELLKILLQEDKEQPSSYARSGLMANVSLELQGRIEGAIEAGEFSIIRETVPGTHDIDWQGVEKIRLLALKGFDINAPPFVWGRRIDGTLDIYFSSQSLFDETEIYFHGRAKSVWVDTIAFHELIELDLMAKGVPAQQAHQQAMDMVSRYPQLKAVDFRLRQLWPILGQPREDIYNNEINVDDTSLSNPFVRPSMRRHLFGDMECAWRRPVKDQDAELTPVLSELIQRRKQILMNEGFSDPSTGRTTGFPYLEVVNQPFDIFILEEVLKNAFDAYVVPGSHGPIAIDIYRRGNVYVTDILDNGMGIDFDLTNVNASLMWSVFSAYPKKFSDYHREGGHEIGILWSQVVLMAHGGWIEFLPQSGNGFKTLVRILIPVDGFKIASKQYIKPEAAKHFEDKSNFSVTFEGSSRAVVEAIAGEALTDEQREMLRQDFMDAYNNYLLQQRLTGSSKSISVRVGDTSNRWLVQSNSINSQVTIHPMYFQAPVLVRQAVIVRTIDILHAKYNTDEINQRWVAWLQDPLNNQVKEAFRQYLIGHIIDGTLTCVRPLYTGQPENLLDILGLKDPGGYIKEVKNETVFGQRVTLYAVAYMHDITGKRKVIMHSNINGNWEDYPTPLRFVGHQKGHAVYAVDVIFKNDFDFTFKFEDFRGGWIWAELPFFNGQVRRDPERQPYPARSRAPYIKPDAAHTGKITFKRAPGSPEISRGMVEALFKSAIIGEPGVSYYLDVPSEVVDYLFACHSFIDSSMFRGILKNQKVVLCIDDISEYSSDHYLYPLPNMQMGALCFLVAMFRSKADGTVHTDQMSYLKMPPAQQEKYAFAFFALHTTKKVMEMCAEIKYDDINKTCEVNKFKEGGKEFLAQELVHECVENFLPVSKGMGMHRFACMQEVFFSTPQAQKRGVSDLDLFFLDHAVETGNAEYIRSLLEDYEPFKDATLGSFYTALLGAAERLGIPVGKKDLEFIKIPPPALVCKIGPGMEALTSSEGAGLLRESQQAASMELAVEDSIIRLIERKAVGRIYDKMIKLLKAGSVRFCIDVMGSQDVFYPVPKKIIGVAGFLTSSGEEDFCIHVTSALWRELLAASPEFRDTFLAELIVYLLISGAHPYLVNVDKSTIAALHAFRFASEKAQKYRVTNVDLFFLEYACDKSLCEYFYYLLSIYDIRKDPTGGFKRCVYMQMQELEKRGQLSILTSQQILPWYMFELERGDDGQDINKIIAISRKLEEIAARAPDDPSGRIIQECLNSDGKSILFKFRHVSSSAEHVLYLPSGMNIVFKSEYFLVQGTKIRLYPARHSNNSSIRIYGWSDDQGHRS
jgi:kojibiose phosphorylase